MTSSKSVRRPKKINALLLGVLVMGNLCYDNVPPRVDAGPQIENASLSGRLLVPTLAAQSSSSMTMSAERLQAAKNTDHPYRAATAAVINQVQDLRVATTNSVK